MMRAMAATLVCCLLIARERTESSFTSRAKTSHRRHSRQGSSLSFHPAVATTIPWRKKNFVASHGPVIVSRKRSADAPCTRTALNGSRTGYGRRFQNTDFERNKRRGQHNGHQSRVPDFRKCASLEEALCAFSACSEQIGPREISFCWNQITKLLLFSNSRERQSLQRNQEGLRKLLQHTIYEMRRFGPAPLAGTAVSVAKISSFAGWDSGNDIWDSLEERAQRLVGDLNAQGLANIVWAFSKVGRYSPDLFDAAAEAATPNLDKFNPQDCSNFLWAYATVAHPAESLFEAIADAAVPMLDDFSTQALSNTVWAYATANHHAPSLFDAVAVAALPKLDNFAPQDFSNMAWAYATAAHDAPSLFDAIAVAALPRLDKFAPQALSNVVWAYATANHPAPSLFDAIAVVAIPKLDKFAPQALSNVVWAYAAVNHPTPILFDAIAVAALPKLDRFHPQGLSNMAWAYATANHPAPSFFDAVAEAALTKLDRFAPQDFSNMAWAYATANHPVPSLLDAIAESALAKLDKFTPQALSNVAWACATAGHEAPSLLDAIAEAALPKLGKFKPQDFSNMVWAYATAGQGAPFLFDAIAVAALPKLDRFDPQALSNMAWAYATAGHGAPSLLNAISDAALPKLVKFAPQDFSNIAWAYATACHEAPSLLDAVAVAALPKLDKFKPQSLSIIAWAYATLCHRSPTLFDAIAETTILKLDKFDVQGMANIAWSFAVMDHRNEHLFCAASPFMDACKSKSEMFLVEDLSQLYQHLLWCDEIGNDLQLPRDLRVQCRNAFVSQKGNPSRFQNEVAAVLEDLGLNPKDEVRTGIGYSLDAVVAYQGTDVGVEVDGPSHFNGRSPNGSTVLKRRQLRRLEGWCLLSVPYWDWIELNSKSGNFESKRDMYKTYLQERLDQAVADHVEMIDNSGSVVSMRDRVCISDHTKVLDGKEAMIITPSNSQRDKRDWCTLASSTLMRKTIKELSEYLSNRGISVTDAKGKGLKKAELVDKVLGL